MVLARYWMIATADPNELAVHRRVCCRHCFGKGHAYQWYDEAEFDEATVRAMKTKGASLPRAERKTTVRPGLQGAGRRQGYRQPQGSRAGQVEAEEAESGVSGRLLARSTADDAGVRRRLMIRGWR